MHENLEHAPKRLKNKPKRLLAPSHGIFSRVLSLVLVGIIIWGLLPIPSYALQPICGIPEHVHNQECYAIYGEDILTCDGSFVHKHDHSCYNESGNLTCGKADFVLHKHDKSCYDSDGNLVCVLPEIDESVHEDIYYKNPDVTCIYLDYNDTHNHVHDDSCYAITKTLSCGLEEGEADDSIVLHTHGDECYERILTCDITGDNYSDSAEANQGELEGAGISSDNLSGDDAADMAEAAGDNSGVEAEESYTATPHIHNDACYSEKLTCELPEITSNLHNHTDACYEVTKTLNCSHVTDAISDATTPVCTHYRYELHTHDETCGDNCGKMELKSHTHGSGCFEKQVIGYGDTLSCTKDEHKHGISCYFKDKTEELDSFLTGYEELFSQIQSGKIEASSGDAVQAAIALRDLAATFDKDVLELASMQELLSNVNALIPAIKDDSSNNFADADGSDADTVIKLDNKYEYTHEPVPISFEVEHVSIPSDKMIDAHFETYFLGDTDTFLENFYFGPDHDNSMPYTGNHKFAGNESVTFEDFSVTKPGTYEFAIDASSLRRVVSMPSWWTMSAEATPVDPGKGDESEEVPVNPSEGESEVDSSEGEGDVIDEVTPVDPGGDEDIEEGDDTGDNEEWTGPSNYTYNSSDWNTFPTDGAYRYDKRTYIATVQVVEDESGNLVVSDIVYKLNDTVVDHPKFITVLQEMPDFDAKSKIKAESLMTEMSLEEKVGQMFLMHFNPNNNDSFINTFNVGGLILFESAGEGNTAGQTPAGLKASIDAVQSKSKIPLIVSVDEEGGWNGAHTRQILRISNHSQYGHAPFKSPQDAYANGGFDGVYSEEKEKAELLASLGFNLNHAPVADVCETASGYIYGRTFGKDGIGNADFVQTAVRGLEENGMGSTLKHFPGYGGTSSNTHNGFAINDLSEEDFLYNDLLPFYAGMAAGSQMVMVTHNTINYLDSENPASCSPEVYKLMRSMGYKGVAVTDDLNMGAISSQYGQNRGGLAAIKAGADIALCVNSSEITSVINAVKSGEIPMSQINESCKRILCWKIEHGLIPLGSDTSAAASYCNLNGANVQFGTFQDMWALAEQNGGKVTLYEDVTLDNGIDVPVQDIVLDLNGYTLSVNSGVAFTVDNSGATFEITDSTHKGTIHSEELANVEAEGKTGFYSNYKFDIYNTELHDDSVKAIVTHGDISQVGRVKTSNGNSAVQIVGDASNFKLSGGILTTEKGASGSPIVLVSGANGGSAVFEMAGGYIVGNPNNVPSGGGVSVSDGVFNMTGGYILGNRAVQGSGVTILNRGKMTMQGGYIAENSASGSGGGICVESNGQLDMTGGHVSDNRSSAYAGGVYGIGNSTITLSNDADVSFNTGLNGGGLFVEYEGIASSGSETLKLLSGSRIAYNEATTNGGGLLFGDADTQIDTIVVNQVRFTKNHALYGGGAYIGRNNLKSSSIANSVFEGNSADSGGGIYIAENAVNFRLTGNDFIDNFSNFYGGAIYISGGSLHLRDANISSHVSTGHVGIHLNAGRCLLSGEIVTDNVKFWLMRNTYLEVDNVLSENSNIGIGLRYEPDADVITPVVKPAGSINSCLAYLKNFTKETTSYNLLMDGKNIVLGEKLASEENNPIVSLDNITLQYYSWTDTPATKANYSLQLNMIQMKKGNMPQNGKSFSTTPYYVDSSGQISMTQVLNAIYRDKTLNLNDERSPSLRGLNRFEDDKSLYYDVTEIWVGKENYKNSVNKSDFSVYDYYPDSYLTDDGTDDNPLAIHVQSNDTVRFVSKPVTGSYSQGTVFYDYDISDGNLYSSYNDATSQSNPLDDAARIDAKEFWMTVGRKGINSVDNHQTENYKNWFGFGNANMPTGIGKNLINGAYNFNMANVGNVGYDQKTSSVGGYTRLCFGLVKGLDSNGNIIWRDDIDVPNLFSEGDAVGKTVYGLRDYSLQFNRVGDGYTLESVGGAGSHANNLTTLTNPVQNGKPIATVYTNHFWPMDEAPSSNCNGHDQMFGANSKLQRVLGYNNDSPNSTYDMSAAISDNSQNHNSYFGMHFAITFTITEDFVAPLSYSFFGDDDLYVFLDGQLVCDLGGVHASAGAVVDLREYLPVDDPNSVGQHELVVYYLERGASGSTCWMHMELPHPMVASTKDPTTTYQNVRIAKSVTGENAPDVKFPIQISIKNYAGNISTSQFRYTDSNSDTGILKSGDVIMLGADDYVLIHDVPDGYQVLVSEDLSGFDSWTLDNNSQMECDVSASSKNLIVKNVYTPKGSLKISKSVIDTDGNALQNVGDVFKFNVKFTGDYTQPLTCVVYDDSNKRYSSNSITSPSVIEIPANGYALIDGFDGEVKYSITEVSCDNYELDSSEGASGVINANQATARFVNRYTPGGPELPDTGGPGIYRSMISGAALLLLAYIEIKRYKTLKVQHQRAD